MFLKWKLREVYLRGIKNFHENLIILIKFAFYDQFMFKKIRKYIVMFFSNLREESLNEGS